MSRNNNIVVPVFRQAQGRSKLGYKEVMDFFGPGDMKARLEKHLGALKRSYPKLMAAKRARPLEFAGKGQDTIKNGSKDKANFVAMVLYCTGTIDKTKKCQKNGTRTFPSSVFGSTPAIEKETGGSCANCWVHGSSSRCAGTAQLMTLRSQQGEAKEEDGENDGDEDDGDENEAVEPLKTAPRTQRVTRSQAASRR